MSAERADEVLGELVSRGFATREGETTALTPLGVATADRLLAARRDLLAELMAEDGAARPPELDALLRRLSVELVGERP